jgi:outer membrane protein assembly factor BamC
MSDSLTRTPQRLSASVCMTALGLLLVQGLGGCSAVSNSLAPNKVDYKAQSQPAAKLDVPPDLTQLANDPRYQPPTGASISANELQSAGANATQGSAAPQSAVTPRATASTRIERSGNQRWLVTSSTPEQLWPVLREYWQANGFTLVVDQPQLGVMETDWLENRGKLPQNTLSRAISKVFESLTDSDERDRYRMLVERGAQGTEVTISHRGAVQVVTGDRSNEQVRWQTRPTDTTLEAEMLARLLAHLTPAAETTAPALASAAQTVAAAQAAPPRARIEPSTAVPTLQVDDGFDRAWRRVGVALDRNGFTVEDRDRSQGVYFVRYVDPKLAGKEDPGFFARLFGAKKEDLSGKRYRIQVAAEGKAASTVSVLDSNGNASNDEGARNIAQLLLAEML